MEKSPKITAWPALSYISSTFSYIYCLYIADLGCCFFKMRIATGTDARPPLCERRSGQTQTVQTNACQPERQKIYTDEVIASLRPVQAFFRYKCGKLPASLMRQTDGLYRPLARFRNHPRHGQRRRSDVLYLLFLSYRNLNPGTVFLRVCLIHGMFNPIAAHHAVDFISLFPDPMRCYIPCDGKRVYGAGFSFRPTGETVCQNLKTPIRQPGASIREESGDRAGPLGQSPQQSTDAGE
jgi:hypothetical protein